jgi:hypothetical protein
VLGCPNSMAILFSIVVLIDPFGLCAAILEVFISKVKILLNGRFFKI